MSITKFHWYEGAPVNKKPDLHITCLSNEKYFSPRWWDGERWWDVSASRGRNGMAFVWPKGRAGGVFARWAWMRKWPALFLRKINDQKKVRYGVPYTHYEPTEVLAWLVNKGVLHSNWREHYQEEMRDQTAAHQATKEPR